MRTAAVISVDELTAQGADWAPFQAMLERFRIWGYDGVEIALRDPASIDQRALARALAGCGLPVAGIATGTACTVDGLSWTDPDAAVRAAARKRIGDQCLLAAQLGSPVIVGLIRGRLQPGVPRAQAEAWMREGLLDACTAGARVGVSIFFEPITRFMDDLVLTTDEGVALLEQLAAPNLGLLLDTFHMNIEESDICAAFRRAGRYLAHVHASDSNRCYPGAGHVDFPAVVATLRDMGYGGYLSAEILPWPDLETSLERAAHYLRRLLA